MSRDLSRDARALFRRRTLPSVAAVAILVTVSATAVIGSSGNLWSSAPAESLVITDMSPEPVEAYVGEPVLWTVTVALQEQGQRGKGLLFTWDWDDGTFTVYHLKSVGSEDTATDVQTHVWCEPGLYDVTISVWDGYGSEKNRFHNVSATYQYTVKEGSAERSVDYRWHDMFSHPLGPWYEDREMCYGDEYTVTDSYPYLYIVERLLPGNRQVKTFTLLTVDALNIPEVNTVDDPQFLPFFGTERGGNAEMDWCMDYITREEGEAKLPPAAMAYYDGWFIALNGSIVLDKQAAKAVLGVTDSEFDDFGTWWSVNGESARQQWAEWMESEADRLVTYNMYEYPLTFVYFTMDAQRVGDEVVIALDTISWGVESLMARWLHEAFMPTEWYMEDLHLSASVGPDSSDIALSAAVAYSLTASESVVDGTPCWTWGAVLGDYVESTLQYPVSDFDPYADEMYLNRHPGSDWYHSMTPYDYTPAAWNLSEGETLTFEWPEGEILFFSDDPAGVGDGTVEGAFDIWSTMTVDYVEPLPSDAPGSVEVDEEARRVSFAGPFDMWTWSKDQLSHSYLADEWERLGILPHGAPYIEFRADPVDLVTNGEYAEVEPEPAMLAQAAPSPTDSAAVASSTAAAMSALAVSVIVLASSAVRRRED